MPTVADPAPVSGSQLRGRLLTPDDSGYELARGIYNQRLAGRPAYIAQCAGVADVRVALQLARQHRLTVSVRGGGHHVAGWASNDGGLVVDLSPMRSVLVDERTSTAWVGGGATAEDVLVETAGFGLAAVTGASPGIGVAGLCMGLGEGYLSPRHGFGADNVLGFELVLADGRVVRASRDSHPRLFWALRGAGANFGVVTALQLRLHPLPEQAIGGWLTFAEGSAEAVTRALWRIMRTGSEYFFPLPVYRRGDDGGVSVSVLPGHTGPADLAEREVEQLRRCGELASDETAAMSYLDLVRGIPGSPGRAVWDAYRLPFIDDTTAQVRLIVREAAELTPNAMFNLWRTTPVATPDPGAAPRWPGITLCLMSKWTSPSDDDRERRWLGRAAGVIEASGLAAEAANTVNHVSVADAERLARVYGASTYRRLAEVKAEYDPTNTFRRNWNINPVG